jgi:heptosyltransferase II
MLTGALIKSAGFILSLCPYSLLEILVKSISFVFVSVPSRRRRLLLSNLKHSFPNWNQEKIKSVAHESSARMLEMGFLSLVYPFLSKEKRKRTLVFSSKSENQIKDYRNNAMPLLILLPHVCLLETLAVSPYLRPHGGKKLGAIYRPHKNPVLDRWINQARLKAGLMTFARKAGLLKARDHLRKGNWLIVLFDQNAGKKGDKRIFLDRLCSISPLPDLLGRTPGTQCVYAFPKRISFFQSQLELREIEENPKSFSSLAHDMLESDIKGSSNGLPEWLWSHGKWKTNDMPHEFFHLQEGKRPKVLRSDLPRKTKVWIRVPNWLGDIVMALPLIRAIRMERPDASIRLLCKRPYVSFLESLGVADFVTALPSSKGLRYFLDCFHLRNHYADAMLLFTNSMRGDIEAFIVGAKLRFGMVSRNRRPLLNSSWRTPKRTLALHQTAVWEGLLRNFGLREELDLSPFPANELSAVTQHSNVRIGIAPGSSNTPTKRLPIDNWIEISKMLLRGPSVGTISIELLGTTSEQSVCDQIENALQSSFCIDRSGKTTLVELMKSLQEIDLLVCNDSGAMHLANCLGTPVLAIFGPTNPTKTGPIFNSPKIILQSSSSATDHLKWNIDLSEVQEAACKLIPNFQAK